MTDRIYDIYMGMIAHYQALADRTQQQSVKAFYLECMEFWAKLATAEAALNDQKAAVQMDTEMRCPNCNVLVSRPGYCHPCKAEGQDWRKV